MSICLKILCYLVELYCWVDICQAPVYLTRVLLFYVLLYLLFVVSFFVFRNLMCYCWWQKCLWCEKKKMKKRLGTSIIDGFISGTVCYPVYFHLLTLQTTSGNRTCRFLIKISLSKSYFQGFLNMKEPSYTRRIFLNFFSLLFFCLLIYGLCQTSYEDVQSASQFEF